MYPLVTFEIMRLRKTSVTHLNIFSSKCLLWWFFRVMDWENALSHVSHLKGFSPVCTRKWTFKSYFFRNFDGHSSHLNLFSISDLTFLVFGASTSFPGLSKPWSKMVILLPTPFSVSDSIGGSIVGTQERAALKIKVLLLWRTQYLGYESNSV